MTIAQFITVLQSYPQDLQIAVPIDDGDGAEYVDMTKDAYQVVYKQQFQNGPYFRTTPRLERIQGRSVTGWNWVAHNQLEDFLLIDTPCHFEKGHV